MTDNMEFLHRIKLYCVDCGGLVKDQVCQACNRNYKGIDGIISFLPMKDENSELFKKYFNNYSVIAQDDIRQDIMPPTYKEAQARKLVKYAGSKIKQKVLDVGAGKGMFLSKIPHTNKLGIDISMEYLKLLRKQHTSCLLANAEHLPFKDEFDLIVLIDILEHVLHPEKVLQSVHRALRVGGRCIIRVPYQEDLSQYKPEKGCKYEFVHLRSFSEQSFALLLEASGLKLTRFHYDGFSMNRFKLDDPKPLFRQLIGLVGLYMRKRIRDGKSRSELDGVIHRLPNWLGNLLCRPYEIVAITEKR